MDLEEILYYLKRKRLGKRVLKVILLGFLFLVLLLICLLVVAVILALRYHTQIYDGFMRIINFVFGDSPDNILRGLFKQIVDNFIGKLFNE